VATISDGQVTIRSVGTTTITAYQAGNNNFEAAVPMQRMLTVNKAPATVILSNLDQTYDGTQKTAGATTSRGDLTVTFTYDGGIVAPADAGPLQGHRHHTGRELRRKRPWHHDHCEGGPEDRLPCPGRADPQRVRSISLP